MQTSPPLTEPGRDAGRQQADGDRLRNSTRSAGSPSELQIVSSLPEPVKGKPQAAAWLSASGSASEQYWNRGTDQNLILFG